MARNNPCKYLFEIKPGEFKEFTEAELKDYLLEQDLSKFKPVQDALQERGAKEKVPRATKPGKDFTSDSERVRSSQQRVEAAEKNQEYEEALRGITKADNMERRAESGLPVYKNEVITDEQIRQQATSELEKGYDLNSLVGRMEQGRGTSAVESEILKMYASDLDARLQKDPYNKEVQKELARFTDAKLKSGSTMGRDFRALQGTAAAPTEQLQTLSDFVTVMRDANGVEELTDTQMKKVVENYENIKKELDKSNAERDRLQELNNQLIAEKEFQQVQKEAQKTKSVKRDYKKERETVIDDIRAKLKESRKNLYSEAIPLRPVVDLVKISPDIAKLVKLYAEEGINKLDQVVKEIHSLLKDEIKGLTEKDVIDSIAGKYKDTTKTINEAKADAYNLKREAKLASDILDLKEGKKPQAKEKEQIAKSRKILELEKELKELRREGGTYDEAKLNSLIKRNDAKAAELERKIQNKEFIQEAKPETFIQNPEIQKKYPDLYNKYLDGVIKVDNLKHDFLMAADKDKLEKEGTFGKVKQIGTEAKNTIMALKAGIDNSAVFVQNFSAMMDWENYGLRIRKEKGKFLPTVKISKNKPALNALKFQWVAARSEGAFNRRLVQIHENKPLWNMIEKSGLDILDPKGIRTLLREEAVGGKNLLERAGVAKYTTAPFERLFSGFSNEIRVSLFEKGAEDLMAQGKTIENSLQDYKDLASEVNNLTGRGKIMSERAKGLGGLLWSPKLLASTLNKLGLSDLASNKLYGKRDKTGRSMGYYSNMNPAGRARAIKSVVRGITTPILIMAALSMQDDMDVDYDPESVTFGQVKNTKTGWSVNLFGPYTSIVRFLTMISSSAASSISGGAISPAQKVGADGKPKKVDMIQEVYKFFRGKANPIVGVVGDIATNKAFTGKPYNVKEDLAGDLLAPLFVRDFIKQYKSSGADAFLYAIPTFYGLKVQNEKQYDERDLKSLIKNNVYSSDTDMNTLFNYNEAGRPVTKEEFDNFVKKRDAILSELITNMHKNGLPVSENGKMVQKKVEGEGASVATKDELAKMLIRLKTTATKMAKEDLFGVKEKAVDDAADDVKDALEEQGLSPRSERGSRWRRRR